MKKVILLIVLIFAQLFLLKSQEKAEINFDFSNIAKDINPNRYTGVFFEFLNNNVNNKLGVCAQEIMDRGMDINPFTKGYTQYWFGYYTCDTNLCKIEYPWQAGYNFNANFHNLMRKNTKDGFAGFSQVIMIDNDSDYEFYCYLKGDIGQGKVFVSLIDTATKEVLYRGELGPINAVWTKYAVDIPKIESTNYVKLTIAIADSGFFEVDETSFKSKTSQYNLRKSFIDMMKYAKPGVLRFPGGAFTDYPDTRLKYSLENVDQRPSPHFSYNGISQRMDFGFTEYLEFCRDMKIEPYIVLNYRNGTPEEAFDFVSYCNDPPDKGLGKIRAQKGNLEPFNVKYWEVGNEIWDDDKGLAKKFLVYYKGMKKIDPTVEIMVPGNHWLLESNIKDLFTTIKDSCDIYSWHPACNGYFDAGTPPEQYIYEVMASWGYGMHWDFMGINKLLFENSGSTHTKNAPTEWWTSYESWPNWLDDGLTENSNLVTSLASIQMVHECVKYWETTSLGCRTLFLGYFRNRMNSLGQRVAYGCGSMYSVSMFSSHHGNDFVPTSVISNCYNMMDIEGYWPKYRDVPYIDAVTTLSEDTIFVSIVNRHRTSKIRTTFNMKGWQNTKEAVVYELSSDSYKDANSADEPLKLFPKSKKVLLPNGSYDLEPHSYTIIAIPRSDFNVSVKYNAKPDFELSLFPNPASNYIIIDTYGKIMDKIEIFNTQGILIRSLKTDELAAGYIELDLSGFAAGVYMIQAELNGQTISDKFTVRK
ncbi:MAG: T9SS type A sorting domain-containing protein [bacterium]